MSRVDLKQKYRPKTLSEMYEQTEVTSFFKSVCRQPEICPRYYLISGAFGCGKTSLIRAFANDFLEDLTTSNYTEIDSSDKVLTNNWESIRDFIFASSNGWKVICFDEAHLLERNVQQKLLKVLEDFVGDLFIFFATTNPEELSDTLRSRLFEFTIQPFSDEQIEKYIEDVAREENILLTPTSKNIIINYANGHLRNALNSLQLLSIEGEEVFLNHRVGLSNSIISYFTQKDKSTTEVLTELSSFSILEVRSFISRYFRKSALKAMGRKGPAAFGAYLKLTSLIEEPEDYWTALMIWRDTVLMPIIGDSAYGR